MTRDQFLNGGKKTGLTVDQFLGGGSFRIETPEAPAPKGFMAAVRDIPSDIKEGFQGVVESGKKAFQTGADVQARLKTGEQSAESGALETLGAGGRAIGEAVGTGFQTAAKLFTSPSTEEKIGGAVETGAKAVAGTETVQNIISRYESLNPEQKGVIDGLLGTAEGLTTVFGLGPATRVAREGAKDILKAGTTAVSGLAKKTAGELAGVASLGKEGIKEAAGKALNPSDIMQRVARIPKGRQAAFQKTAGENVGEYLVKREIFGDVDEITTQLYNRFQQSKNTADEALASLEGAYKPRPVKTALEELFARETRVSTPGALSKDFARVRELLKKYNEEGLSMTDINEAKRIYERNVRLDYLKENKPEAVARATNLDSAIREWQLGQAKKLGLSNLDQINRETRLAKQLLDDLGKEYAGSLGNNAVTLTDWILLANLDPASIGGLITKKVLSSKNLQSKLAKTLAGKQEGLDIKAIFNEKGQAIESYGDWVRSLEGN